MGIGRKITIRDGIENLFAFPTTPSAYYGGETIKDLPLEEGRAERRENLPLLLPLPCLE